MENEVQFQIQTKQRNTHFAKIGRYQLSKTIGKGNFAVVKLGKHEITKTRVAVKIIDKCRLKEDNLRKIYREIQILKLLKHRHIVRLYQVMETETKLFLVTEYASGGEVFEYLRKHNRMNEREARQVFRQVVSAVAYCHSSGVVHRDLKAENLLFSTKNNIKLVDFGFSNFYEDGCLLQTWCGSPPYAAPELFLVESYDGAKADIWSLGVVLYILVCGGFPFPSTSIERLRNAVLEGHINIPFYVTAECADLIKKMLVVNPKQRYNIKQVIQHRWFCLEDWSEEWDNLFRISLDPRLSVECLTLNQSCIIYMQQRGFVVEKIIDSVNERRFDDEYATYYLLCDKLLKRSLPIINMTLVNSVDTSTNGGSGNGSRRGSRGSIVTGQAISDGSIETTNFPTTDLLKLAFSSGDEDSLSSDSECSSAAPSTVNMQTYLSQRRHTALGVPNLMPMFPPPSASGNVGMLPTIPFPLVGNLGEMSNLPNHLMAFLKPPTFLPNFHLQNFQRRESFGTTAYGAPTNTVYGGGPLTPYNSFDNKCSSSPCASPTKDILNAAAEENNVEEMGAHYLKAQGKLKRHTVHGGGDATAASSRYSTSQDSALSSSSTSFCRHYSPMSSYQSSRSRVDPYSRLPPTNRRGSDSTQLTPDMLRHLGRLYCAAPTQQQQRAESPIVENMRHLQQEFQQLRATAELLQTSNSDMWRNSPRASPPNQCLDMIAEHDGDEPIHSCLAHNQFNNHNHAKNILHQTLLQQAASTSSSLATNAAISAMLAQQFPALQQPTVVAGVAGAVECTPQISVTDDSGTTFIHQRAPAADPIASFQMFTNDLLDAYYYYSPQPNNISTLNGSLGGIVDEQSSLSSPCDNNGDMADVCGRLNRVLPHPACPD